ncbi:hypothetical protein EDD27_4452 [Nonomuraea polychroma]|uniref:Uncharacterized protein n=1 Tax=Nonomuraea polychroma TaxID=46176 RepID=A0A438M822_9ACTN|nr:hypothetical protein EDD27_4452 [Nonomuraea polychroma]
MNFVMSTKEKHTTYPEDMTLDAHLDSASFLRQ